MSKVLYWYGEDINDPPSPGLLVRARKEWGLRLSTFYLRFPRRHVTIRDDAGLPVGFYTPKLTPSGVRFGPIYVEPERRGCGYAARVYQEWASKSEVRCVVYAEDGNKPSARAALAAGYAKWKRGIVGTYYRSEIK